MLSLLDLHLKPPQALCLCPPRELVVQDGSRDDWTRRWRHTVKSGGRCQIHLVSETFSEKVKSFRHKAIPGANYIFVEIEQLSFYVSRKFQIVFPDAWSKTDVLRDDIVPAAEKLGQSIIFVRTGGSASELHKRVEDDDHKCLVIQGGLTY